ncbi:chemotaxis protein CheD [Litoreibacter roseus]|uniref:Chemotaxis protein CheD n=1 Tax=Litoreibacter roseus TaxID=2601869 RepID=A0A6N6JLT5_9RHOB|nr:chemotaxis protein CheD [Litoreibacter roseus]GFE66238.1 hypothetical protein KIN_33120 [Litoreibacter roseus]
MNHFLLPGDRIKFSNRKYGTHAMELLINQMLHKGASKATFQAKIFGGADMQNGLKNIGKLNADFARSFLKNEDIPIVAASLNGVHARRVRFWPGTGAAQQLKVPGMEMQADPLQIVRPSTRPRQRGAILFDDD